MGKSVDFARVACLEGSESGGYGYIDEEGRAITSFGFDYALDFVNGVGSAIVGDSFSITAAFNNKGERVAAFDKSLNVEYYDGSFGIVSRPTGDPYSPVRYALIDGGGTLITAYEYEYLGATGGALCHGVIHACKGGKWGALNPDGSVMIPFDFITLQNLGPDSQAVYAKKALGPPEDNRSLSGYFSTDGSILTDCVYDDGAPFENGYGRLAKDGKWAVVDMRGNFVTGFDYYGVNPFVEGVALVKGDDNPNPSQSVYGAIDTSGRLVVPYDRHVVKIGGGKISLYRIGDNGSEAPEPYLTLDNPVMQAYDVKIVVDGRQVYTDRPPVIRDGRTLVPVRAAAEALGFTVDWLSASKTAVIQNSERILRLTVGEPAASLNIFDDGLPAESVPLDVRAQIINDRTFVPLRFVAENFGAEVDWDEAARVVTVRSGRAGRAPPPLNPLVQKAVGGAAEYGGFQGGAYVRALHGQLHVGEVFFVVPLDSGRRFEVQPAVRLEIFGHASNQAFGFVAT
ncbi:MAG: WG repeat-containing protein [Clostridiales Family XIII bacterium]|nr:WG repeat-containing protein [Clostridiales Family XIII bacterium]